jgi:hypothetical protein
MEADQPFLSQPASGSQLEPLASRTGLIIITDPISCRARNIQPFGSLSLFLSLSPAFRPHAKCVNVTCKSMCN